VKKAIIFGIFDSFGEEEEKRISELKALAETASYSTEAEFIQKGEKDRKYLIRRGKVEEIKEFLADKEIELAISENLLASTQVLALEEELKIPVIDRFDLILNIFELHAKSMEAKLQIELARLKRKIPYIKVFLGKKVGSDHPGFGSSGEYLARGSLTGINKRIKAMEKKLALFEKRAEMQRSRRRELGKSIALAGYTNVGKSTLARALTGAETLSKDELFTTLRTKTLSYEYKGENFLVSDTIGFIRALPYSLIQAFRATLSDIMRADLILLVHDASDGAQEIKNKKEVCSEILASMCEYSENARMPKIIHIINKIDTLNSDEERLKEISKATGEKSIAVSAIKEREIEELKEMIYASFNNR